MSIKDIFAQLAEPVEHQHIKWKIQSYAQASGKGMLVSYIDARYVMKRLESVLGFGNHELIRTVLPSKSAEWNVQTEIRIRYDNKWYGGFTDVGEGRDAKSAYSDSHKRAAVHLGIAREFYEGDSKWVATYAKATYKPLEVKTKLPKSQGGKYVYFMPPEYSIINSLGKTVYDNFQSSYGEIKTVLGNGNDEKFATYASDKMKEKNLGNKYSFIVLYKNEIINDISEWQS